MAWTNLPHETARWKKPSHKLRFTIASWSPSISMGEYYVILMTPMVMWIQASVLWNFGGKITTWYSHPRRWSLFFSVKMSLNMMHANNMMKNVLTHLCLVTHNVSGYWAVIGMGNSAGIILHMRPVNERWRYNVTSLFGWILQKFSFSHWLPKTNAYIYAQSWAKF